MIVRDATSGDIELIVGLLEDRRRQLENWEPRFWRKAAASAEVSKVFLRALIDDADTTLLVAVSESGLIGCLQFKATFVPPVYEPGGVSWMVDDFVVANGDWETVGTALLRELEARTIEQKDGQLVFPVPAKDLAASSFFEDQGLSATTIWWTSSKSG